MTEFPESFVWGVATAGHQVEGGNWNSDCWLLEHLDDSPFTEPSGDACDHYHRYPDDVALIARLGFGAYRFSVEWSRVEPERGHFSDAALDHYDRVVDACLARGLAPAVTYNHFTTPRWFAAGGGWESDSAADRFARYCEKVTARVGDRIQLACTLNEPNIALLLHHSGVLPASDRLTGLPVLAEAARRCGSDQFRAFVFCDFERARDVVFRAHRAAVDAIRSGPGSFPVGWSLALQDFQATPGGEERRDHARHEAQDVFLEQSRDDDFVGVQTYSRTRFGPDGAVGPEPGVEVTEMGYEFWPEALGATVRHAADVARVPVHVTENGIASDDDTRRVEYVQRALAAVARCLDDGIDVRGYFYWSAFDNFEWVMGYRPRFGIISVDRKTQVRTPKPSASWLGDIARSGRLPD